MKPTPLSSDEINDALRDLPGWSLAGDALAKTYHFGSFREAMSFMVRVSYEAEALDHHPEWTNLHRQVAIRLRTQEAGGRITARDLALAQHIQALSWVG